MRQRSAVPICILLGLACAAFAQTSAPLTASKPKPTQRVAFAPVVAPVAVQPGGKAKPVELAFRVTPGYHINSHTPTSELLLPTSLKVNPPTNVGVGSISYPAGENRSFPFAPNEKLNVYTGDFAIDALVSAARNTPPGRYRIHGFLKYQACDDRACYPPGQLPIAFDVRVGKAAVATRHRGNPRQSPHVH